MEVLRSTTNNHCTEGAMKRFLLVSLLIIVLIVLGGGIFLRYYLRSTAVAQQVTTEIENLYGGPVRVGSVDVGIKGSSLSDFELYEPGSDATNSTPWLKVGTLAADV